MPDLFGNPLPGEGGGSGAVDLFGNPIGQPASTVSTPPTEEGTGILGTALDILGRPGYASAAFTNELVQGRGLGEALSTAGSELVSPTQRLSYSDVIQRNAPEFAAENPLTTKALGFVGDVALDPTTYLGFGTGLAAKGAAAARFAKAADVAKRIKGKELTPLIETATALRKAGLLSGLKTQFKNVLGTGAFQAAEEVARIPAVIADLAVSAFTKRRSLSGPSLGAVARSGYEAATNGLKEAYQLVRKGPAEDVLAKLDLNKEINSGNKLLDLYVNGVFRFMGAQDKVFNTLAFRRSLEDRARTLAINEARSGKIVSGQVGERTRQILNNPKLYSDVVAGAMADAEIAVFTNKNIVSDAFSGLRAR